MLRINDWYLTTAENITPGLNEKPAEDGYVTINVPDLSTATETQIYNYSNAVADTHTGNTVEVVGRFDDNDTGSYFIILIDDGTHRAGYKIFKNKITSYDGSVSYSYLQLTENTRYTVTLKDGVCCMLLNTKEVLTYNPTDSSVKIGEVVGLEKQSGSCELKIKYLKRTEGIYKYIDLTNVDFELQIDSSKTFDSINLHTYTKSDFIGKRSTLRIAGIEEPLDITNLVSKDVLDVGDRLGDVASFVTYYLDGLGKKYAVFALDAKYRTSGILWKNADVPLLDVPALYWNVNYGDPLNYAATVSATEVTDYMFNSADVDASTYPAAFYSRYPNGLEFVSTINNVAIKPSLANPYELVKIAKNVNILDASDTSIAEFPEYALTILNWRWPGTYGDCWSCYRGFGGEFSNSQINVIGYDDSDEQYSEGIATPYMYPRSVIPVLEIPVELLSTEDTGELKPFDPVSIVCGNFTADGYDLNGLVTAATVHMPPKQPEDLRYYARVRFIGDEVESDYSACYLDVAQKPEELTGSSDTFFEKTIIKRLVNTDEGYVPVKSLIEDGVLVLPETPLADNWTATIYNGGIYTVFVYDFKRNYIHNIEPNTIYNFTYNASTTQWSSSKKESQLDFIVPMDISELVFDVVFHKHIPAYDDVYTKTNDSGFVADFVRSEAHDISEIYALLFKQINNISSRKAERDAFVDRWKQIFKLDNTLFKNIAEMRDTTQVLISKLNRNTLKDTISNVIYTITGAKPRIIEYKDAIFNILRSDNELKQIPLDSQYYLFDENMPSVVGKPFVLYGGATQQFTWQIDCFDLYGLEYSQELIRQVIDLIKPAYTYVVINFHTFEGVKQIKTYYYGIDNYIEAAYNK